MVSERLKNVSDFQKFSLNEILSDFPEYLIAQIRSELPIEPVKNGSQVRIKTLKTLCELLEKFNKKLDALHGEIVDLKEGRK